MKTDERSYILKIDPRTGKTLVRLERPTDAIVESPDSYTTPAVWNNGKQTEIIITGGDVVTGHDPATLKELWRAGVLNAENNHMNRVIASTAGPAGPSYAAEAVTTLTAPPAGGKGDVTKSEAVW